MKSFLIFLCFVGISLEADAQNWFKTAGPVEDNVLDLCIDSNGVLYAVTVLGVSRSTDGGDHWTRPFLFPVSSDELNRITVAPNGNIIASSTSGIYLSADAGNTFTRRFESGGGHPSNAVWEFATTGSGRIFASHFESLLYSDNNGLHWQQDDWGGAYLIDGVSASHDTVLINTTEGIYASFDNGEFWKGLPAFTEEFVYKVAILPNGMWIALGDLGRLWRYNTDDSWIVVEGLSGIYTVEGLRDGSMLLSGEFGIYQLKSTLLWIDRTPGFALDQFGSPYLVTRFVEDRKRKLYYAASYGAGVWKSSSTFLNVNTERHPPSFRVTPNPARESIAIEFTTPEPQPATLKLYDILGRILWKRTENTVAGENVLTFDGQSLVPGSYLIVLEVSGEVKTQWVTIL